MGGEALQLPTLGNAAQPALSGPLQLGIEGNAHAAKRHPLGFVPPTSPHQAQPPPTWRKRLSAMSTQIMDSSSGSMKLRALAMAMNTSSFTRSGTP